MQGECHLCYIFPNMLPEFQFYGLSISFFFFFFNVANILKYFLCVLIFGCYAPSLVLCIRYRSVVRSKVWSSPLSHLPGCPKTFQIAMTVRVLLTSRGQRRRMVQNMLTRHRTAPTAKIHPVRFSRLLRLRNADIINQYFLLLF